MGMERERGWVEREDGMNQINICAMQHNLHTT